MISRSRARAGPAALLLLAAAAAGCGRGTVGETPGAIVVAVPSAPNNLDPRIGADDVSVRLHQLLYTPLVGLDDRLRVVPALATSWETPDDRTYILHLRRGVRFHDGREVTSADVVYTFGSFIDPAFVSSYSGIYRTVKSVTAIDRYTVRFELKQPFGSFLVNLFMGVVPAGSGPSLRWHPVGSGPYRFVRYLPDDRVELAPFKEHFDGPPKNAGVTIKIVPDDIMRGLERRKGTVDLIVNDLAPDIVHQLRQDGSSAVIESPGTDYQYLGFNMRDPILRDRRVRHAIGYAIDRDAIVRYLRRGLATPAVGILPPMCWAFEPNVFTFTHDPARAKQLLDDAGYPDPDGDGPRPRLTLSLKTSSAEFTRLQAAVIQENLRDVGIALDLRSYEFATLYEDVQKGNFQMFTLQWVGVTDPDMLRRVFHSRQVPPAGLNRGHFSNPDVDRLIDAATVSLDDDERRRLYGDAQRLIAYEAPYISLWYKVNVAVANPALRHVDVNPAGNFMFLRDVCRAPCDQTRPSVRRGGPSGPPNLPGPG